MSTWSDGVDERVDYAQLYCQLYKDGYSVLLLLLNKIFVMFLVMAYNIRDQVPQLV